MDSKIFNIKRNKIHKADKIDCLQMQNIVEENIGLLFNYRMIKSNYFIDYNENDYIETLAIDDSNRLVIIEYRIGKFSRVIKKGLEHIDYINSHLSEFKMLVNDIIKDGNINYNPRLVIVSDSFNKCDGDSIRHLPYNIELYILEKFKDDVLLNKVYVSKNIDFASFKYTPSKTMQDEYIMMQNYILELGDEIVVYGKDNCVYFRRNRTFLMFEFSLDEIIISVNINDTWKKMKVFNKALIEKAYDEN